ncbi:uncharacterized protein LOC111601439 [Drosophila hydei]|uniref:Uncharacterized protein LOC111601439 n=1 Tax=Drosophila hydei TaxID=7224 RepID=A0A6J1M1S1_DROHY|nr:uncharacterized protein LOC111601439 [Drosophila hydei]
MSKLSVSVALCAVLVCLSSAQTRNCPRKCNVYARCSPYHKDLVWSIVDGTCRVFQNGCLFGSENCNRVNSCKPKMVSTTAEACKKRCIQICPFGGSGVCASFAETNKDGTNVWKYKTFINGCLLAQYACENGIAYIGEPTEGECPE